MRPQDTTPDNMTFSDNRLSAIKNLANNRILIRNTVLANQPGTGVATINGLNAISFDNDNSRWLLTGIPGNLASFTAFFVVQKTFSASVGTVLGGGGTTLVRFNTVEASFLTGDGTTQLTISTGASMFTAPAIIAVVAIAGSSTRNVYKNSLTVGATGAYDGGITPALFGTNNTGSGVGGFNLGETVIYNTSLSTDEITRIMRYLADKSGVILT